MIFHNYAQDRVILWYKHTLKGCSYTYRRTTIFTLLSSRFPPKQTNHDAHILWNLFLGQTRIKVKECSHFYGHFETNYCNIKHESDLIVQRTIFAISAMHVLC